MEMLSAGVYIQEKKSAQQSVAGVSTSTFASVGWLQRGPVNVATYVTGPTDFQSKFGDPWAKSDLPLAMTAFFQNGGQRAWIVRVVPTDATIAKVTVPSSLWEFDAFSQGTWGNQVRVQLAGNKNYYNTATAVYSRFDVIIAEESSNGAGDFATKEIFEAVDLVDDSGANGILTVVNDETSGSATIKVVKLTGGIPSAFNPTPSSAGASAEVTELTAAQAGAFYDVIGAAKAFTLATGTNAKHYFWFNVTDGTNTQTDPALTGTPHQVAVLTADTAAQVAVKAALIINGVTGEFAAPAPAGAVITVTNLVSGPADDAVITGSGFTAIVTIPGTAWATGAGGANQTLSGTFTATPIAPFSLKIRVAGVLQAQDNGRGKIVKATGSSYVSITGTVNYTTGVYSVTFTAAPALGVSITADFIQAGATYVNYDLAGAVDGTSVTRLDVTDAASLQADKKGLWALDTVVDMCSIGLPDFVGDAQVHNELVTYCSNRKDFFAILDTPIGSDATDAYNYKQVALANLSSYYALYWPNVKVLDPLKGGRARVMSPVGHVAGIYARTDNAKNVAKAPAGVDDGALAYTAGLERIPSKGDMDLIYPVNVNPFKEDPLTGRVVWGSRTGQVVGDYPQVGWRRLAMFLEKSFYNNSQDLVFEPITDELFARTTLRFNGFMDSLTQQGYFASRAPSQAFKVTCDRTNNTDATIAQRMLICDVLFAVASPAEFVLFRFERSLNLLA
jgi:phage tail sheath protein FI